MDIFSDLAMGLATAATPANVLFCFVGVLLGTLIGVLPGVGPTATIAMLLPITLSLSPETSLIMLAGIYYGAQYGGSTAAILINLPGEASAAVTAIDGYQMAKKGDAGTALAVAAIGSFFAGTVATVLIALFAPPLTELALRFGSPEYFSLLLLGLVSSVALAHGSIIKALAMIVLGLLLSLVGTDLYTGMPRYTFGSFELADGLDFVAVSIGLFGISEILRNLEGEATRALVATKVGRILPSRSVLKRSAAPIVRGTFLGSALGILPGGGALLASFASYAVEKKLSRTPQEFGKGAVEGVAGPESANNAAAQTSFIPMLTLGIPANPVMAIMIGALVIQGVVPGPDVINSQPTLFWGIIASMWIGNLFLLLLNLPLIGIWVKLLQVPYYVLFPAIVSFACIGVYSVGLNGSDLIVMAVAGVVGYGLTKLDCEPAPLLLGFVIGSLLEDHLRRSMIFSRGDPMIFVQRPISLVFLVLTVAVLAAMVLPGISRRREEIFVAED